MGDNTQIQELLRFDGVKFFNVNFKIVGKPKDDTDIKLDIKPRLMRDSDSLFQVVYNVSLSIEGVFSLEVGCAGYFELSEEALENENILSQLIHTNAPAIVFPYIRSFVSTFTSNLGSIPSLTLPTHFFKGTLEEIIDRPNG